MEEKKEDQFHTLRSLCLSLHLNDNMCGVYYELPTANGGLKTDAS